MDKRSRYRQMLDELVELDDSVFDSIAATHGPVLDGLMPKLTNAADHGVLWFGVAGLLSAFGGARGRRAALRGLASQGVASLLANQVLKRKVPRQRPDRAKLPFWRNGKRNPTSSSFPSGHAASAAAFAAGAAGEWPILGVPLGTLAAAVGFSRVATGAHYPSDVVGGFILGASVAAWGARVVPVPEEPVVNRSGIGTMHLGDRKDGAGVVLFVNPESNSGRGENVLRKVQRAMPEVRVVLLKQGTDWRDVIREGAADAEIIAVAGGDGTIRMGAMVALELDKPLAVIPAGTFNHFAKDVGVYPLKVAIRSIQRGTAVKVDVGYVNDGLFINTASVGAYTDFVRIREKIQKRVGKPIAAVIASIRTLRDKRAMRIHVDDSEREVSLLFLGNGQYVPQGFAPSMRSKLDDGTADLRLLNLTSGITRWKAIFALVTGRLAGSPYYQVTSAAELDIDLLDGPQRIARDGELGELVDHLHVTVRRRALTVLRPPL